MIINMSFRGLHKERLLYSTIKNFGTKQPKGNRRFLEERVWEDLRSSQGNRRFPEGPPSYFNSKLNCTSYYKQYESA
jgi:hypothetical protein